MNDNTLLAHATKALAYRITRVTEGSKDDFGNFKLSSHTRSPNEIVNHMYDLVSKTSIMIQEGHFNSPPPALLDFDGEIKRLIQGLHQLRKTIDTTLIDDDIQKRLLQGPILDIATHIGQIAMLNGLNGNKIQKESYYSKDL